MIQTIEYFGLKLWNIVGIDMKNDFLEMVHATIVPGYLEKIICYSIKLTL